MKDFLKFVNSRDIRTHWEKIGFQPTPWQKAWLIWQSKNTTLQERHDAWQNLIDTTDDQPISAEERSFHCFLKEHMALERKIIAQVQSDEMLAPYTCSFYYMDEKEMFDETWNFPNYQAADDYVHHAMEEDVEFAEITRGFFGTDGDNFFLRLNRQGQIVRVWKDGITAADDWYRDAEIFEQCHFQFPIPFVRGDMVKMVRGKYTKPSPYVSLFTLEDIFPKGDREHYVYGYCPEERDSLLLERVYAYMDLEYIHPE